MCVFFFMFWRCICRSSSDQHTFVCPSRVLREERCCSLTDCREEICRIRTVASSSSLGLTRKSSTNLTMCFSDPSGEALQLAACSLCFTCDSRRLREATVSTANPLRWRLLSLAAEFHAPLKRRRHICAASKRPVRFRRMRPVMNEDHELEWKQPQKGIRTSGVETFQKYILWFSGSRSTQRSACGAQFHLIILSAAWKSLMHKIIRTQEKSWHGWCK